LLITVKFISFLKISMTAPPTGKPAAARPVRSYHATRPMTFAARPMKRETEASLSRHRTAGKPTGSGFAARLEA
jgi:hypothetical protein